MKPDNILDVEWNILKEKYKDNLDYVYEKLQSGYPVQYLIGNVEFLNTIINVDERVLIPRFETEELVEKTLSIMQEKFKYKPKVIDLGTGSGCIAIALKKNIDCDVVALDISEDALVLAQENAIKNNVNIHFICNNMLNQLDEKYDVIISNPPYIPKDGYVMDSVKDYEPNIALFADDNGIYFYKQILKNHLNNLNKPGLIAFEIGDGQTTLLVELLKNYPNLKYEFAKDLQGLDRYLFIFNE